MHSGSGKENSFALNSFVLMSHGSLRLNWTFNV